MGDPDAPITEITALVIADACGIADAVMLVITKVIGRWGIPRCAIGPPMAVLVAVAAGSDVTEAMVLGAPRGGHDGYDYG